MTGFAEARAILLAHRIDYDAAVNNFHWPDVSDFNWATDWFDGHLATNPESADRDALLIVDGEGRISQRATFSEMRLASDRTARHLLSLGIGRGDRILLLLGNVMPLWEIMLAALKIGAVIVPATPMLTAEELLDRLKRGKIKLVITSSDQTEKFDAFDNMDMQRVSIDGTSSGWRDYSEAVSFENGESPGTSEGDPDDAFLLYFTSGTTAKPKLVMHSRSSYPVGSLSTMYWLGLQPGDVHLNISSPGWAKHAWSSMFAPWNAGATIMALNQAKFSPRGLLDILASHGVNTLCAPPTVWRMIVQEDISTPPPALRELCSAGEPLNAEIIDCIEQAWGLTIRDGYGQTETTAQIGNTPGQPVAAGTMGRPLPGYRLVLRDADGHSVTEGEICIETTDGRPLGLMRGYLTADGSLEGIGEEHYRTGDVAFMDDKGQFTFVGRSDDVFKSSDYRISPFELESALIEHPAIVEAAVVPAPDELRLSIPKAYVILIAGAQPDENTAKSIFAHLTSRLAPYKRIRRIEFVEQLPKTISGKIRRVQLRRQEFERAREKCLRPGEFLER